MGFSQNLEKEALWQRKGLVKRITPRDSLDHLQGCCPLYPPKTKETLITTWRPSIGSWKKVRDRLGYNIRRSYTFKNKRNTLRKELTEVVKPPNSDSLVIRNVSDSYIPIINPSFSTDLPTSSSQNLSNSNHSNVSPIFQVVSTRYSPPAIINESLPPTPDPYLFVTPSRQSIPKSVQLVFNEPQG